MKTLIAALLLVVTPAHAAFMQFQAKDLTVVLHVSPCTSKKILDMIEAPSRPAFRTADVTFKGKALKACWAANQIAQEVLIVDETGDYGTIPMGLFKSVVEM